MRWLFVIALAASCKVPRASTRCTDVANHVADVLGQPKANDIVIRRCSDDHWDREAYDCLIGARTPADLATCEGSHMEPMKAQWLRDDLAKVATERRPGVGTANTPTTLEISVSADDRIAVGGGASDEAHLAALMRALPPHSQIVLHVAGKTNRAIVIRVIDQAKELGLTSSITAEP